MRVRRRREVKNRIRRRAARRVAIPWRDHVKISFISIVGGVALLAVGCGASFPVPTQKLADAESANRSARELGADKKTAAQLNLKLADEEIEAAKAQIKAGDNRRADFILLRAKADAELALALAREHDAKVETVKAVDSSNAKQNATTNGAQ
jgi:hypothetical protein